VGDEAGPSESGIGTFTSRSASAPATTLLVSAAVPSAAEHSSLNVSNLRICRSMDSLVRLWLAKMADMRKKSAFMDDEGSNTWTRASCFFLKPFLASIASESAFSIMYVLWIYRRYCTAMYSALPMTIVRKNVVCVAFETRVRMFVMSPAITAIVAMKGATASTPEIPNTRCRCPMGKVACMSDKIVKK